MDGSEYSRVLVTGGAGFIGSHLVDRLLNEGFEVTVIDNLDTGRLENLAQHQDRESFHFVRGDIRDLNILREAMKDKDAVFHEAALSSVTRSVENPILTNDVNVSGTLNLLKTSLDHHVKRFIFASSSAIYGETASPQKREDVTSTPTSPYGVSKLAAEDYVTVFNKVYGLDTISLRYFNVYGPRQSLDIKNSYGSVIAIFTDRLLRGLPPIIEGDGEQTRDFVYVEDVVQANMLALRSKEAAGQVFNIGTGTTVSVNQVAATLREILGKENLKNTYADPRPGDIRHGYADISKAQRSLGYNPKVSFKEGLSKFVNWYRKKEHL